MSRYAVITADNIVDNVVEWDGNEETWQPPEGMTVWPDDGQQAQIGYIFDPDAHTFTPPAPETPPVQAASAGEAEPDSNAGSATPSQTDTDF